ncbi:MAG TPA: hypothetical protein VGI39_43815 [Polyangiaceae bacterium]
MTGKWPAPERAWIRRLQAMGMAAVMLSGGCHKKAPDPTALVVGVQSDPMGGIVSALHVILKVNGEVVDDETIKPPKGSRVGFPQPWEKRLSGEGKGDAKVDVEVSAMGDPSAAPLFVRRSSTHFVPGKEALLRVPLESRCIVYPQQQPPGTTKVPGPLSGPTCTAPSSCIAGICQLPDVNPVMLEPYATNWPSNAPDRCKPRNAGPPDLQIGTGQSYYLPMTKGQTLQAEAGPQGGHHIWIATRMRNLKQAGSTTKITGVQPETGAKIPPTTLAFTYAPDEGGYCKLFGIRYQLDNEGIDYKQFLGKPLDVTVTTTDPTGATASATAHINIAPTLLHP